MQIGECQSQALAWIELSIRTHLPLSGKRGTETLSRNHINVLTSDFISALPGGPGTASEVELALRYKRPLILYLGYSGTIVDLRRRNLRVARDLEEVKTFIREQQDG